MRHVLLAVWAAGSAVEHIVGREVDQPRVELPGGEGEIAHREGVDAEGGLGFALGDVDHVVCGSVHNQRRIETGDCLLDAGGVADVDLSAVEARHLPAAAGEDPRQFDPKLASATENDHPFGVAHVSSFSESCISARSQCMLSPCEPSYSSPFPRRSLPLSSLR